MKQSELRVLFALQLGAEPYIQTHAPRLGQRVKVGHSLRTSAGVCRRLVTLGHAIETEQGPFLIWRIGLSGKRIKLRIQVVKND